MRVLYKGRTVSVTVEHEDEVSDVALTVLSLKAGNPLFPVILVMGSREKLETLEEVLNG